MKRSFVLPLVACCLVGGLVSCGGGSTSTPAAATPVAPITPPVTPPAPRTTGFSVPAEISPVAATAATTGAAALALPASQQGLRLPSASLFGRSLAPSATAGLATDAGTDYTLATTKRYVAENAINQFSTVETILNAIAQTHYADAVNIGAGPYKSIVSWQQNDGGGGGSKTIQTWVVDSSIIQVGGQDVNKVKCWIEDSGSLVKALFLISASAVQNPDGSYANYGTWTINAKFDDAGVSYFEAQASVGATGETIVAINQNQTDQRGTQINRGVMHKTATSGYGKVSYPSQTDNGNLGPQVTDAYTYNASQLLIQDTTSLTKLYKDRTSSVELDQQYGMFDSVTGEDVLKTHSFGFPLSYTAGSPATMAQAYYGAYQGRHQVWTSSGQVIPDGTTVTRQDQGNSGTSYLTASYTGTLTKRTLVAADISDLLNLPVQTWANFNTQLTWNGSAWMQTGVAFTDFASLVAQPQMYVMISASGGQNQQMVNLVYDPAGASGAGFYTAMPGQNGNWTSTGTLYTPTNNASLWINVGGSIYIEYLGASGWVQKKVLSVDQQNNTPTFDPNGDTAYTLQLNQQYYIMNQGGNYVVTPTGAGAYTVQAELLAAANPVNAASLLGTVATFRPQNYDSNNPAQTSTYTFVSDPASSKYLELVYATVGTQDGLASPAPKVGDPVATGQGSLRGYDANGVSQAQFNWDYPQQGQTFGIQTFLYTVSNGVRTYKLLDDPIGLNPLVLHTSDGTAKTLSLQFDGWMQGLPQFNDQLSINGYTMTADIANKIVNIPSGTKVTNAQDPTTTYLIKPLQEALYLLVDGTPDASLSLTTATAINLADVATLPQYSDNGLGTEPVITVVSYSEGNAVH